MQLSKLRSGMRKLAGVSIPRQDRTSGAFKKASTAAGHAPDAGVADGSSSARARTDRPGRARGGRVGREDGGRTPGEEMQAARKRRDDAASDRNSLAGKAAMNTGIAASLMGIPGKVGKVLKYGNAALGATGILETAAAHGRKKAAEDEMSRLGSSKAKDGEEDRKSGGAVKKGKC